MRAELEAALHAGASRPGAVRLDLSLAGRPISVRFDTVALADAFTPALAHLAAASSGAPELDVLVGAGPPPAPLPSRPEPSHDGREDRFLVDVGHLRAYLAPNAPVWVLDRASGRALCWFDQLDGPLPSWERGAPLRVLVHWWGAERGLRLAHAAAVGAPDGAVLLVGRGGSGKSTTSLAAAMAGLGYLADDYCLVEPEAAGAPRVHCLYGTGKCDDRSLALVPELAERVICAPSTAGVDFDKSVLDMTDRVVADAPIRAVVVPEVGAGPTSLARIPGALALRALAPSTMFQMPGLQAETFAALVGLVRRVECYRLCIGGDPAEAVVALAPLVGMAHR